MSTDVSFWTLVNIIINYTNSAGNVLIWVQSLTRKVRLTFGKFSIHNKVYWLPQKLQAFFIGSFDWSFLSLKIWEKNQLPWIHLLQVSCSTIMIIVTNQTSCWTVNTKSHFSITWTAICTLTASESIDPLNHEPTQSWRGIQPASRSSSTHHYRVFCSHPINSSTESQCLAQLGVSAAAAAAHSLFGINVFQLTPAGHLLTLPAWSRLIVCRLQLIELSVETKVLFFVLSVSVNYRWTRSRIYQG